VSAPAQETRPVTLPLITILFESGLNAAAVIKEVQGRCIDFQIDGPAEALLRKAGADDPFLHELRTFCYRGAEIATVTIAGGGNGRGGVTSSPAGIGCTINKGGTRGDCQASYAFGDEATLVATPVAGSIFTGWIGACSGTGPCAVTMTEAQSVTAGFERIVASSAGSPWRAFGLRAVGYGGAGVAGALLAGRYSLTSEESCREGDCFYLERAEQKGLGTGLVAAAVVGGVLDVVLTSRKARSRSIRAAGTSRTDGRDSGFDLTPALDPSGDRVLLSLVRLHF
jgi:hypothetical protein